MAIPKHICLSAFIILGLNQNQYFIYLLLYIFICFESFVYYKESWTNTSKVLIIK